MHDQITELARGTLPNAIYDLLKILGLALGLRGIWFAKQAYTAAKKVRGAMAEMVDAHVVADQLGGSLAIPDLTEEQLGKLSSEDRQKYPEVCARVAELQKRIDQWRIIRQTIVFMFAILGMAAVTAVAYARALDAKTQFAESGHLLFASEMLVALFVSVGVLAGPEYAKWSLRKKIVRCALSVAFVLACIWLMYYFVLVPIIGRGTKLVL